MHSELLKKLYPPTVEFRFNINKNRSEKVQQTWTQVLDKCKQRLNKALVDEMFEKYDALKGLISQDFLKLEKILNSKQLQEIKDSLQKWSSGMVPVRAMKAQCQYDAAAKPNKQPSGKEGSLYLLTEGKTQTTIYNSLCTNEET